MNTYSDAEAVTNIVRNVIQVAAILVGGLWAYLKFIRGRTFNYRGDLSVRAKLLFYDDDPCITATIAFLNSGLSRIPIDSRYTRLYIEWLPSGRWGPGEAVWAPLGAHDSDGGSTDEADSSTTPRLPGDLPSLVHFFARHRYFESGERTVDEVLVVAPLDAGQGFPMALIVRADLAVTRRFPRAKPMQWTASAILPTSALAEVKVVSDDDDAVSSTTD